MQNLCLNLINIRLAPASLWLLAIPLLIGCSGTSVLKRSKFQLTRSEVNTINRQLRQQIENRYPLLEHKVINRYINGLGQSMVSLNSKLPVLPYEFRVLKTRDVNIFSIPGGIIYITLGAIRSFEVEGQLAAAIAHELAHQYAGHALLKYQDRLQNSKPSPRADIRTWEYLFLGPEGILRYGPEMEEEADRIAPVILYHANYDPRAMLSYLNILKVNSAKDFADYHNLFSTHPPITDRIKWVREQLKQVPPPKSAKLDDSVFRQIKRRFDRVDRMQKRRNKRR